MSTSALSVCTRVSKRMSRRAQFLAGLVLAIPGVLAAQVSVSPSSLNWVSVPVGGKGGQKVVTLTNSGSAAITISSIGFTGANPGDFEIFSKTCGSSLAGSTSCTANIIFAPTATGNRSATLNFKDSASNSPQTMALTGYGAPVSGTVSVSPTSLSFGNVTLGSTGAAKSTTLTNGLSSSISISSVAISGTNAADFSISSKSCGTSLTASGSCSASVVFKPSASGTRTATLSFTDSATNSPQKVALSGTGSNTTSGSASVSPTSLNWVSVAIGGIGGQKVATLTNGGTTTLNISSVALGGTNPGDFKIYSKTCGATLAASASCTANVVFAPIAAGHLSATLNFNDSATNSPQAVVLTGYAPGGTFTISPLNPTVSVNGKLQFTASASSSWTATCGTIGSSTGLYTAPATAQTCTVKGTATSGGQTASTTVTVTTGSGQVTITPASVSLHAIGLAQFTANQSVTWSTSCGSITSAGLFTAPVATETCTIKATSTTNSSNTASASAHVTVVNYTSRKNGNDGTGVQRNEYVLTPASVSSGKFAQLWSVGLDGPIWGQPLYMNGLTIGGVKHNVVYVTTSNDSVYAIDGDTGKELWKRSFLSSGVTPVSGTNTKISTQTGILSTPVIDPVKQALFVVVETSENSATYFPHRLHSISLATGQELTPDPELISDPDLQPLMKFQRPALLLANGMVYVAFGSIEDRAPYHGLLFAFDENTLEQKAVWNVTPTGNEGGLWMSGAAPLADSAGNIYVSTGNGSAGTNNFGESIVKLSPTLQELDYFTPYNFSSYDSADLDLGSGSLIVVPDQNGPYPHEIIACGKPTPIYVINRDAFGGRGTTSDNIIQRLDHQIGGTGSVRDSGQPCYNSPAMWQENVYFAPNYDVLKMFVLNPNTGMLSTAPASKGTFTYSWPGADPVISANGNTNGIVWTIDISSGTLRANDATNVSKNLYTSANFGSPTRWVPPTVVNGHVYVTASGRIIAYGLSQ